MRIIAGSLKGRVLRTVPDLSVRPATSRVRQTLFNMLVHRLDFDGLQVLDLYAGSGSLGFEAISRGAERVTFVERDPSAVGFLEGNAEALGCSNAIEIVTMDAGRFLDEERTPYGLIFADPPYAEPLTGDIPSKVFGNGILRPGGLLLIEHASSLRFEDTARYSLGPQKKFGRTMVTFFHHPREGT